MNTGMKDILNTMSKFLNLGMTLQNVITANTSKAADVIKRPDLGRLSVGGDADIAVLNLRRGTFGFIDTSGGRLLGERRLECELTVKGGQVVWDLNGISRPLWTRDAEVVNQKAGGPIMRRISLLLGLVLSLAPSAWAQLASQTALVGTVTDPAGLVVPGAYVVAVNTGTKDTYEATTNTEGYYHILFARPGNTKSPSPSRASRCSRASGVGRRHQPGRAHERQSAGGRR